MGYPTFVIATCVKALYEASAKVEGVPSMWGDVVTMEYREESVKKRQERSGGSLQKMAAAAHGAVDSAVTGICAVDDAVHSAALRSDARRRTGRRFFEGDCRVQTPVATYDGRGLRCTICG